MNPTSIYYKYSSVQSETSASVILHSHSVAGAALFGEHLAWLEVYLAPCGDLSLTLNYTPTAASPRATILDDHLHAYVDL